MTKFTVFPELCTIEYTCDSVIKQGTTEADNQPISCSDFTFDGLYNGQSTDGKLVFEPNESQYIDGTFPPGKYDVVISGTEI